MLPIEKQNKDVNNFLAHFKTDKAVFARRRIVFTPPEPVEFGVSGEQALQLRRAIGRGLQKGVVKNQYDKKMQVE